MLQVELSEIVTLTLLAISIGPADAALNPDGRVMSAVISIAFNKNGEPPVTINAAEDAELAALTALAAAAVAEAEASPAFVVAVAAFVVLVDTAVFIAAVLP